MKKITGNKNFLVIFLISCFLSLILFSCTQPNPQNPFDPETELNPMQGQLLLTQLTDSQVQLQWQLNESIEGEYIIERKVHTGSYHQLTTVNANISNFTDTALSISNTYYYRLIGANDENQTEPLTNSIQTTFAEITDFQIEQQDLFSALLTWTHICSYEEGYIIERREIRSELLSNSKLCFEKKKPKQKDKRN